jgi:hypothetical protein
MHGQKNIKICNFVIACVSHSLITFEHAFSIYKVTALQRNNTAFFLHD